MALKSMSRRSILKLAGGSSLGIGAWLGGVLPELNLLRATANSGPTVTVLKDAALDGELTAVLAHAKARGVHRHLLQNGFELATKKDVAGQVTHPVRVPGVTSVHGLAMVYRRPGKASTTATVMAAYVGDRPGDMYLVPAIHTQLNATQLRIDELLVDEQGKVRPSTESAIVDLPTKRFRISNTEGKVRLEGTYGEFVERGRAIMASGKANGATGTVVQAYADLSCAGCREGGTFMVAAGCGAVAVLGALACGPAAPACAGTNRPAGGRCLRCYRTVWPCALVLR